MPEIEITEAVVAAVSGHLPGITDEQVTAVLTTWNTVQSGDPLGTVLRDPDTGNVAHRVVAEGVHMWHVTTPNGEKWNDLSPTLNWTVIHQPD